MASNKGKRSLDKPTRDSLNALDRALELSCVETLRDDEFTAEQYAERARNVDLSMTDDGCRAKLGRLVRNGTLKIRKITMRGKQCNAYSFR